MTTLFASAALLPSGLTRDVGIEVESGRIARVTAGAAAPSAAERHALIVPGVPNLHSHAFQRAMSGLAERRGPTDDSFWSWRTTMYKFALSMTPDDVEAVAAQLYVEMLEAGFTRVGEFHYLHHDETGAPYSNVAEMAERIAAASSQSGIGLTLLPVFYAHSGFGPKPPCDGQRRFVNNRDRFAQLLEASRSAIGPVPEARIGVAPHSLRAATLHDIREITALPHDGPIHIHIAEQMLEVRDCVDAMGARPVQLLAANVALDNHWCLIHATHMEQAEIEAVGKSGAVAGLCPITEANLGDGIFSGTAFRAAGGRYGVGSDSNVQISLAAELRQLEYSQRLARQARNVLVDANASTGQALMLEAAGGGAQALGVGTGIAVGMPADLVSLDSSAAPYLADAALLDAFVFASGVSVGDVWVSGKRQVSGGRHRDRDAIRSRFDAAMARLVHA